MAEVHVSYCWPCRQQDNVKPVIWKVGDKCAGREGFTGREKANLKWSAQLSSGCTYGVMSDKISLVSKVYLTFLFVEAILLLT